VNADPRFGFGSARRLSGALVAIAALWSAARIPAADTTPIPHPIEPPSQQAIDEAIDRGIAFLFARQEKDGSWGSPRRTKDLNIYAPVPGGLQAFHTGATALALAGMIEAGCERPDVAKSIDRAEAWLFENLPLLRRATPDAMYNTWGHAYSIQALVRMLRRKPDDAERCARIRKLIEEQVEKLTRYECVGGGWAYYDFNAHTQKPSGDSPCFVTATVLIAFDEARRAGIAIPQRLIDRAKVSILRQRKPDFTYLYSENHWPYPMMDISRPGGSLGRSQACNIALRRWGDKAVTDEVLVTWLERLFARNGWLSIGRKRPVPHESWFLVAGYFYYYGHYYAALCIEDLPPERRARYQDYLAHTLIALQEKDGSWWDYPLYDYHQQYGTGFALMTLVRCRRPSI